METQIDSPELFVFRCNMGMTQDTCKSAQESDPESRAVARGITGCPACKNRVPDNRWTANAELRWATRNKMNKLATPNGTAANGEVK